MTLIVGYVALIASSGLVLWGSLTMNAWMLLWGALAVLLAVISIRRERARRTR